MHNKKRNDYEELPAEVSRDFSDLLLKDIRDLDVSFHLTINKTLNALCNCS